MSPEARLQLDRIAEAGQRGSDVRSDLWVRVEPSQSGGIDLDCQSRVDLYYGDRLRAQIAGVFERMGVEHARVHVEDAGALPFAIEARVECAIRRGRGETGPRELQGSRGAPAANRSADSRNRLRRSRLYLPGNSPKFFINAPLHGADGLILDLEDSVSPGEKDAARFMVREALVHLDFRGAERMVRINQLPLGLDDLAVVVPESPDLILLPKCEDPEQVMDVEARIVEIRRTLGLSSEIWLMPILESPLGIEKAYEIGKASPRVVALTIGLEDYTAELGVNRTEEGRESFFARQAVINAARASGLQPIDSVYSDVADMESLAASAREARSLGFEGKGCIHPSQIRVINEAFAPSRAEIEKALRIVEAFDEARQKGRGVVSLGSKMIDAPVVKRAERTVTSARNLGLIPDDAADSGAPIRGEK